MNDKRSRETFASATANDREIVMTRVFGASRRAVFAAFTNPELVKRWLLGPDGWSMPICEIDLRTGGSFRYVWRNDTAGHEFGLFGTYREIVPPERIVHAERYDDPSMPPGDTIVTTTFDERHGATTVTMVVSYESKKRRDEALESGMERGVVASFDRLAAML